MPQNINACDLLGQGRRPATLLRLAGDGEPKLEIAWGSFHQSLLSSVKTLLDGTRSPREFLGGQYFKDCWIERRIPRRALLAAALWHIVFVIFPFPRLPVSARRNPAFENTELTWSGPIHDLPLLDIPGEKANPSPRGEPQKQLPPQGADAFHPRQRIFTDPVRPTHPRQTLINSAAPPEPPRILPSLPNVVQLQSIAAPPRPRIQISEQTLANLRPRETRVATVTDAPLPDVPNLEQQPAEINLAVSPNAPAKPKLQLNASAAPHVAQRATTGDAGPAPDVGAPQPSNANGAPETFIALSATPAPPAGEVPQPQGNLAARVAISPEGRQPGVPGGSPNGTPGATGGAGGDSESIGGTHTGDGVGNSAVGISIRGGNPPSAKGVSGLGGTPRINMPKPRLLVTRPDPKAQIDDPPERIGPPNFAALPPGAKPEQIFASKRVYTLNVNMPNLNSATGSWILNFSEMHVNGSSPRAASADLTGPVPLRKVDPKYPPMLINEHVEGEVVLYAVIRHDGSVDSIQLVHGIDEQLDDNAVHALSQWKFQPATKQATPVDLEAIVHIPFRAPVVR